MKPKQTTNRLIAFPRKNINDLRLTVFIEELKVIAEKHGAAFCDISLISHPIDARNVETILNLDFDVSELI